MMRRRREPFDARGRYGGENDRGRRSAHRVKGRGDVEPEMGVVAVGLGAWRLEERRRRKREKWRGE